jgi:putative flippase GtrA
MINDKLQMTNNKSLKILVVVPVYNEELVLKENILKLYNFLKTNYRDDWQIVIADNGSTDGTGKIGQDLSQNFNRIKYLFIKEKGKGGAIRKAWENGKADIYCFMDVDLSTDLKCFPSLISAIDKENFDIAIGSRFKKGALVERSLKRKIFSYGYRFLLKLILKTKIEDAACGFKAVKARVVKELLPKVKNNEWFFDSELLILAEKNKYKIKEIPIKWIEQKNKLRKSKASIFKTSFSYLREISKLDEARTFLKFLVVGFFGFTINALGLRLLVENFHFHPSLANIIAAEVAIISNFIWNNSWTFNERKIKNPFKIFYKFSLFNLTSAFGVIIIQTGTIHLGVSIFGKSLYMFYFLIGTALLLIWNFTVYNRVIWRYKQII